MSSISINQASAQMADCQTTLSLVSFPSTGTVGTSGLLHVNLLGEAEMRGLWHRWSYRNYFRDR